MTRVRNALVFKRYVIVTKKAQRTHEEVIVLRCVCFFCVCCENIDAFYEIEIWINGCNFAASKGMNRN